MPLGQVYSYALFSCLTVLSIAVLIAMFSGLCVKLS